ncbi:MAG: hypothetical protein H6Q34_239, partial [Deltaproteobacteria bacterium]|nr:hypothetical protein [Deltaproteobacteria bacterium]
MRGAETTVARGEMSNQMGCRP